MLQTLADAAYQDSHVDGWGRGLSAIGGLGPGQSIVVLWNGYKVVRRVEELSAHYAAAMLRKPPDVDNDSFWWHLVTKRLEMDGMGPGYVYPVRIPLPEGQTLVFHFFTPHFGDNRASLRVHQYIMHAASPREYLHPYARAGRC